MLQQTQAARVGSAFDRFIAAFPTVRALADAPAAAVLRAWGGLGYNRRALALHRAARALVRDHGGRVPRDPAVLVSLPGVGPYTAAAVASLAFGAPIAAVDVNVRRVVSRALLGGGAGDVEGAAAAWLDRDDPGRWNQAIMDLGREVCRPVPLCGVCPIAPVCRFRRVARPGADAGGSAAPRRQPPFAGSSRQVRGAVVRVLRDRPRCSLRMLTEVTGHPPTRVAEAVVALHREGLIAAGPAALRGGCWGDRSSSGLTSRISSELLRSEEARR